MEYVWQLHGGVSTRLMGALIMTSPDEQSGSAATSTFGPDSVVIVPIYKNDEQLKHIQYDRSYATIREEKALRFRLWCGV